MTNHVAVMAEQPQKSLHIGWGLSALTPYYLLGQTISVSAIICGAGARPGEAAFGLPVYGPDYLANIVPSSCTISSFPDLAVFGASIQSQIAPFGEFELRQATIWADDRSCEPEQYRDAVQHWITNHRGIRYIPEPRQVCLFINKLDKGGAERQIVLLACGLKTLGHDVTLICQSPDDASTVQWQQQLSDANVERLWLSDARQTWQTSPPVEQELQWLSPLCRLLRPRGAHNVLSLSRIYARLRPQYVISYLDDCNFVSAAAAIVAGVSSCAMSVRSTEPNLLHPRGEPNFYVCQLKQMKIWYQSLLDLFPAAKLYANSEAGRKSYEGWLSQTLSQSVLNAVESVQSASSINLRTLHSWPDNCEVLLGIMRLTEEKNPDGFIRVFAALKHFRPTLRAVLLGDGPMRPVLEKLARQYQVTDSLVMPGKVDDTTAYLQQANCLLCPSHTEGMPNVILEAQAQGLPLIATKVGGTQEALAEELHGFLVDANDENAMCSKLEALLQNETNSRDLFRKVQVSLLANRNQQRLAEQTLGLFS